MNRRKVLSWFGLGWLASGVPVVLTGCTNDAKTTTSSTSAADPKASPASTSTAKAMDKSGFKMVGTMAQLEKEGQIKVGDVLIVRDRANLSKPLAVNPTCTHKGCTVDWKGEQQEFVCPCHRAVFAPDGSVRKAPAKESLASVAVKVENGQILIAAK
jgi:cytochrome b6-f complex iron-sulfur subunit